MNGAQFSAINSLRTGNVVLDMMIAMIIPVIFRIIFTDGKSMLERIRDWLFGKGPSASNDCIRTIAFQSVGGSLMGRETKNNVLQKALTLYLTEANVPFEQRAQVSLTALHDVSVPVQRNPATDQFDPLARYRLAWNAPDNEWVEIEKGLRDLLGRETAAQSFQEYVAKYKLPYAVVPDKTRGTARVVTESGAEYSVEELVAMILQYAMKIGEGMGKGQIKVRA